MKNKVIIVGAGVAGLSAAIELAKNDICCILISDMPSQRAQSIMAQGGINAAYYTDDDSYQLHALETYEAGRKISDYKAIENMCKGAPDLINDLYRWGMSFSLDEKGDLAVRAFGGQSKKRTFYASSSTGRQLMHTFIDQVRKYEAIGFVERWSSTIFVRLLVQDNVACGCEVYHQNTNSNQMIYGPVIVASGGLNGLFNNATGSLQNTGCVSADLFSKGVHFANLEFIQYHPTTVRLHGKNMLITEAARGEGGRLYVMKDGKPYYFMEEKYPEKGNLMPRDVVSKEEYFFLSKGMPVYLDISYLDKDILENKLSGLVEDCKDFIHIDPSKEAICVEPGIHYFMGGIWVDIAHRTSMKNLYAAGECACQYHGANRLGGNSLLGAIYGARVAAKACMEDVFDYKCIEENKNNVIEDIDSILKMRKILEKGMGMNRNETLLKECIEEMMILYDETKYDRVLLAQAMLMCANERKESRGCHIRGDYPNELEFFQKQTLVYYKDGKVNIKFVKVGEENED